LTSNDARSGGRIESTELANAIEDFSRREKCPNQGLLEFLQSSSGNYAESVSCQGMNGEPKLLQKRIKLYMHTITLLKYHHHQLSIKKIAQMQLCKGINGTPSQRNLLFILVDAFNLLLKS
jgi:hypothetical protein